MKKINFIIIVMLLIGITNSNILTASKKRKAPDGVDLNADSGQSKDQKIEVSDDKKTQRVSQASKDYKRQFDYRNIFSIDAEQRQKTIKLLKTGHRLNLDDQDEKGNTLLHNAAVSGNYAKVYPLVHLGVPVNLQNKEGKTPLALAIENKNVEVQKFLQINEKLLQFIISGNVNGVNAMLKAGASVNTRDFMILDTPLYMATEMNNEAIVQLLLERGASANEIINKWTFVSTPLHFAVWKGLEAIVRLFLEAGANVNSVGGAHGAGYTPLHFAALQGHESIAQLLLEAGADKTIRAGTLMKTTALDLAQSKGYTGIVALLEG